MRAPLTRWYYEYPIIKNKEKIKEKKRENVKKILKVRGLELHCPNVNHLLV